MILADASRSYNSYTGIIVFRFGRKIINLGAESLDNIFDLLRIRLKLLFTNILIRKFSSPIMRFVSHRLPRPIRLFWTDLGNIRVRGR